MELTGELKDFPLTDILQILGLSRKTGTLSVVSESLEGRVAIVDGRIIHAWSRPGESVAEVLAAGSLSRDLVKQLVAIGARDRGKWTLESLLLESGLVKRDEMEAAVRRHIHAVIGRLVGLEKGRFGITLNDLGAVEELEHIVLSNGLDVGEVLLEAAKETDERERNAAAAQRPRVAIDVGAALSLVQNSSHETVPVEPRPQPPQQVNRSLQPHPRPSLLCSLLAELRVQSFEAEVSLLIMRYASEIASRGILFVVKDDEIRGLGQFGIKNVAGLRSGDEIVREIRIPLDSATFIADVARTRTPFIGEVSGDRLRAEVYVGLADKDSTLEAFAFPLVCRDRALFVFYGDNHPGGRELTGLDEFMALVDQSAVVLEKIVLERALEELQHSTAIH